MSIKEQNMGLKDDLFWPVKYALNLQKLSLLAIFAT